MSSIIVDQAWMVMMKYHEYDLVELKMIQLKENLSSIRNENNSMCKFGSLIVCTFFYIPKYFPRIGNVVWEKNKPLTRKINEFITQLGDTFYNAMNTFFNEFKSRMKRRMRILEELVTKYYSDICFLVDTCRHSNMVHIYSFITFSY